jgi:hypothetical protein
VGASNEASNPTSKSFFIGDSPQFIREPQFEDPLTNLMYNCQWSCDNANRVFISAEDSLA